MSFPQVQSKSSKGVGPSRGDRFVAEDGADAGAEYKVLSSLCFGETLHVTLTREGGLPQVNTETRS